MGASYFNKIVCTFTLKIASFLLLGSFHSACFQGCPAFWTRFRGNCYRFFGIATTWADAEAQCNEYFTDTSQGHLVSIHNKEESDFVFKLWHDSIIQSSQLTCSLSTGANSTPFTSIFLGLHDRGQNDVFVWTDGSPNDYNEWGPGQPSNSGGHGDKEDCTLWIDPSVDVPYKPWNDLRCHEPTLFPFVCKLKLVN